MKKVMMSAGIISLCLVGILSSCKKEVSKPLAQQQEDALPPTGEEHNEVPPTEEELANQSRISYCNNPVIEDYVILFDRQVGHGFNFTDYWVEDWDGDGDMDMIAKNSNQDLWFYRGYAINNQSSYPVPNITSDAGIGHWDYKFQSGVKVGNGWGNFVQFYPGKWNSDNTTDLMALHSNGTMYVYFFNGSSFYSSITVNYPLINNPTWEVGRKRYVVDLTGNGKSDLVEISDPGFGTSDNLICLLWGTSNFSLVGSQSGYDVNDEFYFHHFDNDNIPDMMVRKANGDMIYRNGLPGVSPYCFSSPQQVGNGWNIFSDIFIGDTWNICTTKLTAVTGRTSSGVFKTYVWNPGNDSFWPGVQVGTGWNFTHIWVGDLHPDIYYRHDFLARDQYGRIFSYYTLLDMLYF